MSKFTANDCKKSFRYANKGIRLAIKSQRNFRIQLIIAFLVIIAGIVLGFNSTELCIMIFAIAFVLTCELFNSVIEFSLDALYRNKYSKLVEMAKDMAAAAVLISTIAGICIGIILFSNKILALLSVYVSF